MILMIDQSEKRIKDMESIVCGRNVKLGQLRTPLTGFKGVKQDIPIGIDNGCFVGKFNKQRFDKICNMHKADERLKFVTMPDVVGDARRTLELFDHFSHKYTGLPKSLVIQDGIEHLPIPWDKIESVFIGGTNAFKDGAASMAVAKAAKILGKWVHVGRVNSADRIRHWMKIADSCDGSGIAKYDHMFNAAVSVLSGYDNIDEGLQYNIPGLE
jgi:hypothetical protein